MMWCVGPGSGRLGLFGARAGLGLALPSSAWPDRDRPGSAPLHTAPPSRARPGSPRLRSAQAWLWNSFFALLPGALFETFAPLPGVCFCETVTKTQTKDGSPVDSTRSGKNLLGGTQRGPSSARLGPAGLVLAPPTQLDLGVGSA